MKSHGKLPIILKNSNNSSFMDYTKDYQKDCQTPTPQTKHLNGSIIHSVESGYDEDSKSNLSPSPLTNNSSTIAQSTNYTPSFVMRNPSLILNSNSTNNNSTNNYDQLLSTSSSTNEHNGCLTPHSICTPVNNTAASLSDWYMQQSHTMTGIPSMPTPPSNNSSPNSSTSTHHPLNTTSHHHHHHNSLSHHSHLNSMSFNHPHLNYTPSHHFHAASY